jgi:(S)-ureidoglycine aminohydrolase
MMPHMSYAFPGGGMPPQSDDPAASGAVFTASYAIIPGGVMRDAVASLLPGWTGTRAWILARPLSGFAETFAQYAVEVLPAGGSEHPEPDTEAEAGIFVASGEMTLTLDDSRITLAEGGFAYIPPGQRWAVRNDGTAPLRFHWLRKRYEPVAGHSAPGPVMSSDADVPIDWMDGTETWGTTRFVDPDDVRHDMHVNIVTFEPGGRIPFAETHVMEHGLYVLAGTAEYLLNRDWVSVAAGDFLWLRSFCPQACIATGTSRFRYLLYKDVNRHPDLTLR